MRVYTCTPVPFKGDYTFFSRDSGLMSVGLAKLGIESRAIMPTPAQDDDDPRLIRTEPQNLESPEWWISLGLDGLIFYSWAAPRYNRIAKAIRAANIPLLVYMDTSGLVSRIASPDNWRRESHVSLLHEGENLRAKAGNIVKAFLEASWNVTSNRRMEHYEAADKIAAVTPHGAMWIPNEALRLGRPELAEKFIYLPHPQLDAYNYDGRNKEPLVVTVGRWHRQDWAQKNPKVLLQSYYRFLESRPSWKGLIVGSGAPELAQLLHMERPDLKDRLEFIDYVRPEELPAIYQRARIGFWSSRWEGQQGTGAQALCCGCSVVSSSSALNSCFRHYVSRESGRLAHRNTPTALAEELLLEADAWDRGERDPERISRIWSDEFHAVQVAGRALDALELRWSPSNANCPI
jgi:glycosyltransferase involved in cell wall biosynthesis